MYNFEDDIILNNYKIPWLIWIQIIIMFLLTLTILVSFFGFFTIENNSCFDNNNSLSLISSPHLGSSNFSLITQVAGNRDACETNATTGNRLRGAEHNAESNSSSVKALVSSPHPETVYHPCCYFDLAKQAFLKCLGLGSTSRSPKSPDKDREHEE